MQNQQWLIVGLSTLLSGTLVSIIFPSAKPLAVVAAGTAGAIGGTFVTKRKEDTLPSNQQIVNTLAKIQTLLLENKTELAALKKKINISLPIAVTEPSLNSNQSEIVIIPSVTEVVSEEVLQSISQIIDWLNARKINVETYHQPQEVDVTASRIAMFLGHRYASLKPLYKQIKFHTQTGNKFYFRLAERSKEDISNCTNFCQMLSDNSYLAFYRYLSTEKLIVATPQTNGNISNFLQGGWFERFIYQKICALLAANELKYYSLMNIKGTFDNGNDYELDLLFLVESQPLWIECKSGKDYNSYLARYCKHRKKLGILKERAFLVILDLSDSQTVEYTNLWDITVANINNFLELISHTLGLSTNTEQISYYSQEIQKEAESA